jgi:LysR family hca operon transcriptional activator
MLALAPTEAAMVAARQAAQPAKPSFALGFLTGQEIDWLPEAMNILKGELPSIDVTVSSQYSPQLAGDLMRGRLDLAFLRPEPEMPDLVYKVVMKEKLMLVLPSDLRLASQEVNSIQDMAAETFLGMSKTAPLLQIIIDIYLNRCGVEIRAAHEIDNLGMAISLVASTRGVTLLPAYAQSFLPWSVISRLVIGYNKANTSPILKLFCRAVMT